MSSPTSGCRMQLSWIRRLDWRSKSNRLLTAQKLTQVTAASQLGVSQPKISALKNYKLDGFSVERLMSFLLALGHDVEIRIMPRQSARAPGRIVVQTG